MKIGAAQIQPVKGDIEQNILQHKKWIELAASLEVDLIIFPELSLTGYEPSLASKLAIESTDNRLDELQNLSDQHQMVIGVGAPTKTKFAPRISMLVFQPQQAQQTYSKQYLHADERAFFSEGGQQLILNIDGLKLAPAICYEALMEEHAENAVIFGARLYLTSAAKSANGVARAQEHFPAIAGQYLMPVIMANSVGPSDNFISAGTSAVWNLDGELLAQLNDTEESLLIVDTRTEEIVKKGL